MFKKDKKIIAFEILKINEYNALIKNLKYFSRL